MPHLPTGITISARALLTFLQTLRLNFSAVRLIMQLAYFPKGRQYIQTGAGVAGSLELAKTHTIRKYERCMPRSSL